MNTPKTNQTPRNDNSARNYRSQQKRRTPKTPNEPLFTFNLHSEYNQKNLRKTPKKKSAAVDVDLISAIFDKPKIEIIEPQKGPTQEEFVDQRRNQRMNTKLTKIQQTTLVDRLSKPKLIASEAQIPIKEKASINNTPTKTIFKEKFINTRFNGVEEQITLSKLEILLRYFNIIDQSLNENPGIEKYLFPIIQIEESDNESDSSQLLFNSNNLRCALLNAVNRIYVGKFWSGLAQRITYAFMNTKTKVFHINDNWPQSKISSARSTPNSKKAPKSTENSHLRSNADMDQSNNDQTLHFPSNDDNAKENEVDNEVVRIHDEKQYDEEQLQKLYQEQEKEQQELREKFIPQIPQFPEQLVDEVNEEETYEQEIYVEQPNQDIMEEDAIEYQNEEAPLNEEEQYNEQQQEYFEHPEEEVIYEQINPEEENIVYEEDQPINAEEQAVYTEEHVIYEEEQVIYENGEIISQDGNRVEYFNNQYANDGEQIPEEAEQIIYQEEPVAYEEEQYYQDNGEEEQQIYYQQQDNNEEEQLYEQQINEEEQIDENHYEQQYDQENYENQFVEEEQIYEQVYENQFIEEEQIYEQQVNEEEQIYEQQVNEEEQFYENQFNEEEQANEQVYQQEAYAINEEEQVHENQINEEAPLLDQCEFSDEEQTNELLDEGFEEEKHEEQQNFFNHEEENENRNNDYPDNNVIYCDNGSSVSYDAFDDNENNEVQNEIKPKKKVVPHRPVDNSEYPKFYDELRFMKNVEHPKHVEIDDPIKRYHTALIKHTNCPKSPGYDKTVKRLQKK